MQTRHRLRFDDASRMHSIDAASVDLVVTSPPYPMIEMWDGLFAQRDAEVGRLLARANGLQAFERMHRQLDAVWREAARILKPGGIACINIGDAVRSLDGRFQLFSNHSRVLARMIELNFCALPHILWRKPTNAPTKFMGSGMLPPSAYVTLEHEYILILRKGDKRSFAGPAERHRRRRSAFFWEERNRWFSDVWMELRGTAQRLAAGALRQRSAAFPFEIPFRLILMFSVYEDTVVDPFCGTGTTLLAAMAAGRNSIGFELDRELGRTLAQSAFQVPAIAEERLGQRIDDHHRFVADRLRSGYRFRHQNRAHGFAVMTAQETELQLQLPATVRQNSADVPDFTVEYAELPNDLGKGWPAATSPTPRPRSRQRSLFS